MCDRTAASPELLAVMKSPHHMAISGVCCSAMHCLASGLSEMPENLNSPGVSSARHRPHERARPSKTAPASDSKDYEAQEHENSFPIPAFEQRQCTPRCARCSICPPFGGSGGGGFQKLIRPLNSDSMPAVRNEFGSELGYFGDFT